MKAETRDPRDLVPRVFFREGHFYIVDIYAGTEAEHAHLNPGTLKVEDMRGNTLWQPGKEN